MHSILHTNWSLNHLHFSLLQQLPYNCGCYYLWITFHFLYYFFKRIKTGFSSAEAEDTDWDSWDTGVSLCLSRVFYLRIMCSGYATAQLSIELQFPPSLPPFLAKARPKILDFMLGLGKKKLLIIIQNNHDPDHDGQRWARNFDQRARNSPSPAQAQKTN